MSQRLGVFSKGPPSLALFLRDFRPTRLTATVDLAIIPATARWSGRSWILVSLSGAMRQARPATLVALLLSYLLLTVGAQPLHWWQVEVGAHTCSHDGCGDALPRKTTCGRHCDGGTCHTHHQDDESTLFDGRVADPSESLIHPEVARGGTVGKSKSRPGHHAADCAVCRILGQTQDLSLRVVLECSQEIAGEAARAQSQISFAETLSPFNSRGPPRV